MISRMSLAGYVILAGVLAAAPMLSQQATVPATAPPSSHSTVPASSSPSYLAGVEFPVVMRQNVEAGKTPVGTKVEARLAAATLVKGMVIPEGAIFQGEIIDSVAKSAAEPSRLAIRIDSAHWKNGSLPVNVYLTAWYYPVAPITPRDSPDARSDVHGSVQWGAASRFPPPSPRASLPGNDDDTGAASGSNLSKHRVLMKDVDSKSDKDKEGVTLTSTHLTIKLDKSTTYVLATSDLGAKEAKDKS